MRYACYSLLFALLYVLLGFGLTVLCAPERLKKHILLLAPLVGYCYLALVASLCYDVDLRGTDVYAPFVVAPPLVLLLYVVARRRQDLSLIRMRDPDVTAPLVIGIVTFVLISSPLIGRPEGPTTISIGNNDLAFYASAARYVKEFARSEPLGFIEQADPYVFRLTFGSLLSTAVPSSLYSIELYKLQNVTIHVFFAFGAALLYALARRQFFYKVIPAAAISLMYGVSPIMWYTVYHGFQPQIIGTTLSLGLFLVHGMALETRADRLREYGRHSLVAAFLTWGTLVTYAHMLPLIYAMLICYSIPFAFRAESRISAAKWWIFLLAALFLNVLISPSRATAMVELAVSRAIKQSGWHVSFFTPGSIFGFTLDSPDFASQTGFIGLALSALLAGCVFLGIRDTAKNDRKLFLLCSSLLMAMILGYVLLAYPMERRQWGGYKSYKMISFFLPLFLLASLPVVRNIELRRNGFRAFPIALLVILLGGNAISCYYAGRWMRTAPNVVTADLADLKRVEENPLVESINVTGTRMWDMMWQIHFLLRKKLFFQTRTYYAATSLDGQWDLRATGQANIDILHIASFEPVETITINSSYVLERPYSSRVLRARFGAGWHESERTHRWTGPDSNTSSIVLDSTLDHLPIAVGASYWPLDPNNRLSIFLDGARVADCPDNRSCRADRIVLSKGNSILEFRCAIPPSMPAGADTRRVGYAFTSIEIYPAAEASSPDATGITPPVGTETTPRTGAGPP